MPLGTGASNFTVTSGSFATLTGGVSSNPIDEGDSVVLVILSETGVASLSHPFELDIGPIALGDSWLYFYRRSNINAAMTFPDEHVITQNSAGICIYAAYRFTSVLSYDPPVASSSATDASMGTGEQISTGFGAEQTEWNVVAIAAFAADNTANTTAPTWGSYTNSFVDATSLPLAGTGEVKRLATAYSLPQHYGPYEVTATLTTSSALSAAAAIGVYRGAYDPPYLVTGFETGTMAGATAGIAGSLLYPIVTGAPTIVATSPRNGSYCLRCSTSASTAAIGVSPATYGQLANRSVGSVGVRFPTSLPASDVNLITMAPTTGAAYAIRFRASDNRLVAGLAGGTGTPTEGPVVVADTWYTIDWHWINGTPCQTLWRVDTVDQPTFEDPITADSLAAQHIGWLTASTATVDFDDLAISSLAADYPMGPVKVVLLTVDPAGTVSLTGTAANWRTYTTNGTTLTAWNDTTARGAVDEVPPTIGATADGIVQVTAATGDFVTLPMTSYTLLGGEAVIGCRIICCGFAVSGTTATLGFRAYNGTTEQILQAGTVDPAFDNSTTSPGWFAKMMTIGNVDTQAKIDGLAIRFGYSSDATPDVGIHAAYAELAVAAVAQPPAGTHRRRRLKPQYRR